MVSSTQKSEFHEVGFGSASQELCMWYSFFFVSTASLYTGQLPLNTAESGKEGNAISLHVCDSLIVALFLQTEINSHGQVLSKGCDAMMTMQNCNEIIVF